MSTVTPIRPGSEPGEQAPAEILETPTDILMERLRHARAIVDLIHFSDRESLDYDTVNNALWVVDRYINEAQEAAERLSQDA